MNTPDFALGVIWYFAFLFSLTCHEAAHALVAKWGGDKTAYEGGQVTLNPIPHVKREIFGTVVVPILTYLLSGFMMGWASAPFNLNWALKHPRRVFLMSVAGPLANFLLFFLGLILIILGMRTGYFVEPNSFSLSGLVATNHGGIWPGLVAFLSILTILNLFLGVFNLLPIPPLDGGSVYHLFLSRQMSEQFYFFASQPVYAFLGLFIAYKVSGPIFGWVFDVFLRFLF